MIVQATSTLAESLKYKLPTLRLCLVREDGETQGKLKAKLKLNPIRTPADAAEFLAPLKMAAEEHFLSLHLNSKHEIIGLHEVSHGTLSASLVHPREVFKAALLANSYAIIVCHNHPSGSALAPSKEDLETTDQLLKAGSLLGVSLLDHLILSPTENTYSLREHNPQLWQV